MKPRMDTAVLLLPDGQQFTVRHMMAIKHQRDRLREALDNLVRVYEGDGGTKPFAIDEARAALREIDNE